MSTGVDRETRMRAVKVEKLLDAVALLAGRAADLPNFSVFDHADIVLAAAEAIDRDGLWESVATVANVRPPSSTTTDLVMRNLRRRVADMGTDPFAGL